MAPKNKGKVLAFLKEYFKRMDPTLLILALMTSGYGLVLISSAGKANPRFMIVQGVAIALGVVAYFVITLFDIAHLAVLWKWALVFNLALLSTTLFFGVGMEQTGNNSWIRFQLGGVETGLQPAEIGKVIYILTLAQHFKILGRRVNTLGGLVPLLLHGLLPVAFVYLFSKDDGMAVSYLFIFILMAFAGGIYLRFCVAGLAGVVAAVPLFWNFIMGQYQRDRFIVLFDTTYKLDSIGYHQMQSRTAIANGGWFGAGLYNGPLTQYGHLPTKQTDFIFSVACEELGFIGGFIIILLLTAIILKCVADGLAMRDDRFSMLMCVGVAAMLTFQTFINVGMNLGVAPVVGLTLPFISYGGTSVVTMFAALGIVSSLKRHYIKRVSTRNIYES